MRFRLHYSGPLHANADERRKHEIRRSIHPQLATIWESPALNFRKQDWVHPTKRESWFRKRGPFDFVPMVNHTLFSIASLQITWLRPGELGSIVSKSGDIDNRLKTLFDALRVPDTSPTNTQPASGETPFYCLLDDDSLITEVDVVSDRLLVPNVDPNHVEMIIGVKIRSSRETLGQVGWWA
jgi:hypothetical protein